MRSSEHVSVPQPCPGTGRSVAYAGWPTPGRCTRGVAAARAAGSAFGGRPSRRTGWHPRPAGNGSRWPRATHHRFDGTYATGENFRIMPTTLDEVSVPRGRPVRASDQLRRGPVHARDRHLGRTGWTRAATCSNASPKTAYLTPSPPAPSPPYAARFQIANHKAIGDGQALHMRHVHDKSYPARPVAAIFGANAAGKSKVLDAFALHGERRA